MLNKHYCKVYETSFRFENHLKQSIFSIGAREIAEKDVEQVKEVIESTFDNVIK